LDFDGAVHCVDDTPELDNCAIASALDDATVMGVDRKVDQIAAQSPQPRQCTILIRPREPALADDICDQDRRDFTHSPHGAPSGRHSE
jgi:hypothetical protein